MMKGLIESAIAGITAFAATNIDDIVILMLFFASSDPHFRPRHIVAGQYLGFMGLVLASLPGFFGGMMIPDLWLGWLGLVPIGIGVHQILNKKTEEDTIQLVTNPSETSSSRVNLLGAPTFQVAAITFANGGDNIGIYVPLFARSNLASLSVILAVFALGVALWCWIASRLTRHPLVAKTLTKYSHQLVPFVLIGLGIFIFIDSGTYQLLVR
jgi:cadmium resistance transport/sequestration family protein